MERVELENLRKEMARHKKKYAKEDEEMLVHSASEVIINITIIERRRRIRRTR